MRWCLLCVVVLVSAAACQHNANFGDGVPDLAITNVTVIDAEHGVRPGMTVVVRGERIVAVLPADAVASTGGRVVDGNGRYLIPGLWDMHVHITYEPMLRQQMASLFLDFGITSVRDTGGLLPAVLPEVARWRAEGVAAPTIYFSGPLLDGNRVVYDGRDRPEIGIRNQTVAAANANVDALAEAGADFIKIYELVSPEVFAALVARAEQHQMPIAAHVPLTLLADQAGPRVNSMEHLRNIELACAENADQLLDERRALIRDQSQLSGYTLRLTLHSQFRPRALASAGVDSGRCPEVIRSLVNTIQVPTLRLNTIARYSPLDREDWLAHLEQLPVELANQWRTTAQSFRGRSSPDSLNMADWSMQLTSAMHHAGVPVAAGTDTPIAQAIPGYSLHTELERLVAAGLSPLAAMSAATVVPARFFGLDAHQGNIAPGQLADLVLLDADPLQDIRHTRRIVSVISRGRVVR